ncbi:MAG: 4-vinyl reductase, partial [Cyanobacteria bacterium Co-bin13]|nr:4-vinyl reductase [Cyanobacteria bacterium Co-bin13]
LQQCWQTHGWGQIQLETAHREQGFLVVEIWHSPFTAYAPKGQQPAASLEQGIVEVFLSQLTGRALKCLQTSCDSKGDDCNRFVVALEKRLEKAVAMVASGQSHQAIMQALLQQE